MLTPRRVYTRLRILWLISIIGLFIGGLIYIFTHYDFSYEDIAIDGDNNNYNEKIQGDVYNGYTNQKD